MLTEVIPATAGHRIKEQTGTKFVFEADLLQPVEDSPAIVQKTCQSTRTPYATQMLYTHLSATAISAVMRVWSSFNMKVGKAVWTRSATSVG